MNRYVIVFLFLFAKGFAQKPYSETYYPFIDKAESALVEGNYKDAFNFYYAAFSGVRYALARDLFNAAATKVLLNDFEGAKPYLLKLAAKGVPPELLQNEEIILRVFDKWEAFKPIYLQIYDNFTPTLSDEVLAVFEKTKSASPRIIRSGTVIEIKSDNPMYISGSSFSLSSRSENQIKLEKLLDSTGGFYEHQAGMTDQELLLDNLNTEVFTNLARTLHFTRPENVEITTTALQHLNTENYINQGIENGKWHRDIIGKTLNTKLESQGIQVTQVSIDETCTDIKAGIYYKLDRNTYKEKKQNYTEDIDLVLKKAIFKYSDNLFKLPFSGRLLHQTFPTCETAKKALFGWSLTK